MRRLLMLCAFTAVVPLGAQSVISPGMARAQVVSLLGKPLIERAVADDTYLFFRNGCERTCGMNDLVVLKKDAVVDAVFRSARRRYTGNSSSPRAIPAAEARKARPTAAPAAGGEPGVVASLSIKATKATLYDRLGGLPAVRAAVHEMVTNAMADPRIKAFFAGVDMQRVDRNLVDFVCRAAGGPCTYTGKSMAKAHEGLNLKPEHFLALVDDLQKGLDKLKVPVAEQKDLINALDATRKDVLGK